MFSLFSDETRIRIVLVLRTREHSVDEFAELIGKSSIAISQHLAKLRWCKVVQPCQEGTRVYYSLVDERARELVMRAAFQAEHVVEIVPPHHTVQGSETAFERKTQEGNLRP